MPKFLLFSCSKFVPTNRLARNSNSRLIATFRTPLGYLSYPLIATFRTPLSLPFVPPPCPYQVTPLHHLMLR